MGVGVRILLTGAFIDLLCYCVLVEKYFIIIDGIFDKVYVLFVYTLMRLVEQKWALVCVYY